MRKLENKKIGKWTILSFVEKKKNQEMWLCRCDCGREYIRAVSNIIYGKSTQCFKCQAQNSKSKTPRRHDTRIYHIWACMKQRCNNPNSIEYYAYGGKGVRVCPEWNDFSNFYKWAIENGYNDELTIDRINTNGIYEPSNCRWADLITQANNKTNNKHITIGEETHTIAEWCREKNLKYRLIQQRYYRGERGEDIFRSPQIKKDCIEWNGKIYTQRSLAKELGIPKSTFNYHVSTGKTIEQILQIRTK